MLDKITAQVLFVINEICADGTYKVIELGDIIEKLPNKLRVEADGLKQIIKYLRDREYIDIKYSDDSVYCLFPQPKGRLYFEREHQEKEQKSKHFKSYLFTAFFGAMAGAIIGSVITAIVTGLILS